MNFFQKRFKKHMENMGVDWRIPEFEFLNFQGAQESSSS
jgi:hypothetical protein